MENLGSITNNPEETENPTKEVRDEADQMLIEQLRILSELAYKDQLTGLMNRHALVRDLEWVFKPKSDREDGPERREGQEGNVCAIMIDIDHFRKVNTDYGHDAGDFILREVSDCLKDSVRSTDLVVRLGGEEILILLLEASEYEASKKAERLRKNIESKNFEYESKTIPITISVGVSFGNKNSDPKTLIKEADEALYQSKNSGRNQVTTYSKVSELANK
jgi:diguanylate cyclase (GGDEF)-like protein